MRKISEVFPMERITCVHDLLQIPLQRLISTDIHEVEKHIMVSTRHIIPIYNTHCVS